MFQTEFSGPHYKLLISWDSENHQNYSFDNDILKDPEVFNQLNQLYRKLSDCSTDFVECMKSVHGPSNLEQVQNHLHENNPNVTFKIENCKNQESYEDELFLLRQQVEKLKEENKQLMIDHENEITKLRATFEERIDKLTDKHEQELNLQKLKLENDYTEQMTDLRKYFENKCNESLRQFTEESYHCSRDSDSDSVSDIEPDNESYEAICSTECVESNFDLVKKDLQKLLDKDVKYTRKAYISKVIRLKEDLTKKKDEEINQLKHSYATKFQSLQAELDRLTNDQAFENCVNYVNSQVKREYENERDELQNRAYIEFENDLLLEHGKELDKRDEQWSNHLEDSLSDVVVESAFRNVVKENHKSQSCHCSPSKKYKYKDIKQIKQKYKQKLDDLKQQYENELKTTKVKCHQEMEKLNNENYALIHQNKELLETNEKQIAQIDSLKNQTREYLHSLQSQEAEIVERITNETAKLKNQYDIEVSNLRKALQECRQDRENVRRDIISSLETNLKNLKTRERHGETITWPEELNCLKELLRPQVPEEHGFVGASDSHCESDNLNKFLKEREILVKAIPTIYNACEVFRRHITNLDEERSEMLSEEIKKTVPACLLENFRNISNISVFADDAVNVTIDGDKTFNESELMCWVDQLKSDAAAILSLASGKLSDRLNVDTQTDIDGQTYDQHEIAIENLQKEISQYHDLYTAALRNIEELTDELNRLNDKVNSLESLEAYGEGVNGLDDVQVTKPYVSVEEFCSECDRVREEARKDKEDLQSQIEAASKKHKSLEVFLERETAEREAERDEFDKNIRILQDQLKEKEREISSLKNNATEINQIEIQLKELTGDYEDTKIRNKSLETELNAVNDKIWTLRERNHELESKLAQKSVLAEEARNELSARQTELQQIRQEYETVRQELDSLRENGDKQLDLLREQHEVGSILVREMKNQLFEVEKIIIYRTRELENYVTVSSSNVVSSPSEDVSVCDRIADRLLISPSESDVSSSPVHVPVDMLSCLNEKLRKLFRAEDAALKRIQDQEMQINKFSMIIERLQLERDTFEETFTETNSKLVAAKVKLDQWQKLNDFLSGYQSEDTNLSSIVERLLDEKNKQIHQLEDKIDAYKSMADIANKSHSTEMDSKGSSKHVNFTESLESYSDLDRTRHAVDETISPRYISISSSVKKPLAFGNESSCSLQPIQEVDEKLARQVTFHDEVTFKDDSIQVNLDDLSWTRTGRESTKIDADNVDGSEIQSRLDDEKRSHYSTLMQLRDLNTRWEVEKEQMKEKQDEFTRQKCQMEKQLRDLEWECTSAKDKCDKYEQQVVVLGKDLDTKKETIDELKKQIIEMEKHRSTIQELEIKSKIESENLKQKEQKIIELTTMLEAERNKILEMNDKYDQWFKSAVNERVEAQVKCGEYSRNVENLEKELQNEKIKTENLTKIVENLNEKKTEEVNALFNQLQNEKKQIIVLNDTVGRLEGVIRQLEDQIRIFERKKEEPVLPDSSHNSTLIDLTHQVQKQVDLAALLDENMLQSLEFDSKTESFLEELMKLSPVRDDMRQILLKILQGGFQALNTQEKDVLRDAYYSFDVVPNEVESLRNTVQNLSDLMKQLQLAIDSEKKINKEVNEKNYKLQLEINRSEMVHSYFEERISFLISKLDEYRNKAVKVEIELTMEKTSRRQVELMFDHYKRQMQEKQAYDSKKLEETLEQLNITSNENLKLKQESEVLHNKIESLIAELNSVKAITQYHSDSESELSRSLNPIKERLREIEEKYARLKHDYEKKKMELRTIKANLNVERCSVKKLECTVKEISSEKHKLEKQLIDKNSQLEDLNWQKNKLEEKLKAAELAEMKRRKMKLAKDDAKKDFECAKETQRKVEKECEELQKNVLKLVDDLSSMKNNCRLITQEAQRIFLRMLKAERSQRSLVYQKNYLVVTLYQFQEKCNCIVRRITNKCKTNRLSMKQKFRSLAICVISMHRMKYLVTRRISNNCDFIKRYFLTHVPEVIAHNGDCFDEQSMKKLCLRERKKDTDIDINLMKLCQQYADLRRKFVDEEKESC